MDRLMFWPAMLALAFSSSGCDALRSPLEQDPDDIPLSEIIGISQSRNPPRMPADGRSVDTITVEIPRHASTRKVSFLTTRGSFERRGGAKTVDVRALVSSGDRLRAIAVLVADTTVGIATVWATVGEFTNYVDVELTQPPKPGLMGGRHDR